MSVDKFKSDIIEVQTFKRSKESSEIFITRTIYKGGIKAVKLLTVNGELNSCTVNVDKLVEGEQIVCSYDSPLQAGLVYLQHVQSTKEVYQPLSDPHMFHG